LFLFVIGEEISFDKLVGAYLRMLTVWVGLF